MEALLVLLPVFTKMLVVLVAFLVLIAIDSIDSWGD